MTLVIAHRGASALEVENSLAAFRKAVALGADAIELDVHATSDCHAVVVHDEMLGRKRIGDLSLADVRTHRLSNGELVPTLSEALAAIGPKATVFVEVKTLPETCDASFLLTLDTGPVPGHYHIHSFDRRLIRRLQAQAPGRRYGLLFDVHQVNPLETMKTARATELWKHDSLIAPSLVNAAHAAGCTLYAWTVDDPVRMRELRDMGVDGICTNRPDVARAALA